MAAGQTLIRDDISNEIIASVGRLARQIGADKISVRDVLKEMNITNRVFYNRFHNIEEVWEILYRELIEKIRESISEEWQPGTDFFDHVRKIALRTLEFSYEHKGKLSQFIFETDSSSNTNFLWWSQEIKKIIAKGRELALVRNDIDDDCLSYSVWCYIRGFNADAIGRNLSKDEAMIRFGKGFDIFLEGIRA